MDLNCDVGEGARYDQEILTWITSANIACGAHAGDTDTMKSTIDLCVENKVHIGAHPGYNDKPNFGRIVQTLKYADIVDLVGSQIIKMQHLCQTQGASLKHIKPHGALYNLAMEDATTAHAIIDAIYQISDTLIVFGLPHSIFLTLAQEKGLVTKSEGFLDRSYLANGQLTPRHLPNAVFHNISDCLYQLEHICIQHQIPTHSHQFIPCKIDTVCLHGDGANVLPFLQASVHFLKQHQLYEK